MLSPPWLLTLRAYLRRCKKTGVALWSRWRCGDPQEPALGKSRIDRDNRGCSGGPKAVLELWNQRLRRKGYNTCDIVCPFSFHQPILGCAESKTLPPQQFAEHSGKPRRNSKLNCGIGGVRPGFPASIPGGRRVKPLCIVLFCGCDWRLRPSAFEAEPERPREGMLPAGAALGRRRGAASTGPSTTPRLSHAHPAVSCPSVAQPKGESGGMLPATPKYSDGCASEFPAVFQVQRVSVAFPCLDYVAIPITSQLEYVASSKIAVEKAKTQ